jgi:hypothetical protein
MAKEGMIDVRVGPRTKKNGLPFHPWFIRHNAPQMLYCTGTRIVRFVFLDLSSHLLDFCECGLLMVCFILSYDSLNIYE